MKSYFIYIMASKKMGTLYVGVTSNLIRRVYAHKNNLVDGFTKEHGVHILVWFDQSNDVNAALEREKQLKNWNRAWKIALIEKTNKEWRDLYDEIVR